VRNFAQEMIRDHTNSTKQLKQIAQRKGFTLPKDVGADNQPLVTQLKNISGSQFNRAYMEGQVQAHSKTQAEYQKYIQQGQDQDLQAFANKISPIVAEHLQMAQKDTAQLQ
jgi:putative membrane protein